MLFKRSPIITPILLLLWLVAVNHCAFESLFSAKSPVQSEDCHSHPKEDPSSHPEGLPCTQQTLVSSSQQISFELSHVVLSEILILNEQPVKLIFVNKSFIDRDDISSVGLTHLLSLSIASNAPPITA